jgi:hypothetical protein
MVKVKVKAPVKNGRSFFYGHNIFPDTSEDAIAVRSS